uniref:CSON011692 protein n=1 Tax=Culicoides sonorensis TaxID=179676 RepID=A0A336LQS3_CULSO
MKSKLTFSCTNSYFFVFNLLRSIEETFYILINKFIQKKEIFHFNMVYLEDLKTCNKWCCCIDLRVGNIITCILNTVVYLYLTFSELMDNYPLVRWFFAVIIVVQNTLLIVGTIKANSLVLKIYLWASVCIWVVKAFLFIKLLITTPIQVGYADHIFYFLYYLLILFLEAYFFCCVNSYYLKIAEKEESMV